MIVLIPIGEIEEAILETLRRPLAEAFDQGTQIGDKMPLPRENYYHSRHQYLASPLLSLVPLPNSGNKALGLVGLTSIFLLLGLISSSGWQILLAEEPSSPCAA